MKIILEIGGDGRERTAEVIIHRDELSTVHLNLAYPDKRNRSDLYMRRHRKAEDGINVPTANCPERKADAPSKLSIAAHLEILRAKGAIPKTKPLTSRSDKESFSAEPSLLAVPISDLVANLLRPCYHKDKLGAYRIFFFKDEPIKDRRYFCIYTKQQTLQKQELCFGHLKFDLERDRVTDENDMELDDIIWAAALVPLVVDQRALSSFEIAVNDYDLRQILGRDAEDEIRRAYDGWYGKWNANIAKTMEDWDRNQKSYSVFYHSIIAVDGNGCIHIFQQEGALPIIANELVKQGIVAAGLLDSGGSCCLYDPWMASYLNQCRYYREKRGAILVFELKSNQWIPVNENGSWLQRRLCIEENGGREWHSTDADVQ
jgi:hypothetical protein